MNSIPQHPPQGTPDLCPLRDPLPGITHHRSGLHHPRFWMVAGLACALTLGVATWVVVQAPPPCPPPWTDLGDAMQQCSAPPSGPTAMHVPAPEDRAHDRQRGGQ